MVIKINNRFHAGAYRWLGGKHYWILDTKTGIKYKGLNESNFQTVARNIKNSHDLNRTASGISHYTYQGRLEGIRRMADSFASMMTFKYGSHSDLTGKFKKAIEDMAMKDPELWDKFVEKNNEWFTEYWEFYGSGAYDSMPSDNKGKMSQKKKKLNAKIEAESRKTLESIIDAMEETSKTGKVKVITHELKDYRTLDLFGKE